MEEKVIVFNLLYDKLTEPEQRKNYLAGLGEEFDALLASGWIYLDERDYKVYNCMFIGNRRWLRSDFRFKTPKGYQANQGLYNWEGAVEACPVGWRIPISRDFYALFDAACEHLDIPPYLEWLGDEEEHTYELLNVLGYDKKFGFHMNINSYYDDTVTRYWRADQSTFYNHEGQNERSMGFSTADAQHYCHLRLVQDWPS